MHLPHRQLRLQGLFGWCLALLALCALNLQGLHHYQPRMLLGADICASSGGGTGPSDPQKTLHRADCGMCCGMQENTPWLPSAAAPFATWVLAREALARPRYLGPAPLHLWSPSRPRGPPFAA
jgi:hypothetical protein